MKQNNKSIKNDTLAVISGGTKGTTKLEAWKYWEIVGDLIFRNVERLDAYGAAKWAIYAEVGEEKELKPDVIIKIRRIK